MSKVMLQFALIIVERNAHTSTLDTGETDLNLLPLEASSD